MSNIIFALFIAFGVSQASKTPVLIWSPTRPLSDLPQSYAGETIKDDVFTDKYLKPLTSDPSQSVVVFLQDKLSVEDFTNHADVYNPSSDGGAFKNVKSAMDDQFSVHLPAVVSPKETIESLSKVFSGKVIKVDNPDEFANLKIKDNEGYLIIVSLQPIRSEEEFGSFKRNDEAIGKCLHHMNKRSIKYSAIYTAESSSKAENMEVHGGRQLLEEKDKDSNGTFVSIERVNVFLKTVSVYITPKPKDANTKPVTFHTVFPFEDARNLNITKVNETVKLTLSFKGDNGSAILEMMIVENRLFEFISVNGTFKFTGNSGTENDVDDMPINYKIQATKGFCFHCTKLRAVRDYTRKDFNGTSAVEVILNGFQIEAFNPYNSSSSEYFTSDVWDCVEFFTIPIWMGIITTLLLLTILFYGITMIANITTMDRFDDPKGKTITITVNE
ncbi:V-type proton ATPase subunit S1-like [Ruditapes philippinarum]|uniref:V-type proton ATPase subunit S1-like n=1 Tax=Ruditapes philippinarum TaxID=129788 RepID=UPI00295B56D6|nr:V-type proton ATPase subunit S1-like [Ruditapes philippinarum]